MDFTVEPIGRYIRVIAIITLALGLNDAAQVLGITLGSKSPLEVYGTTSFIYLAVFTLALLFAAVGLWMKTSWGAMLLAVSTAVELAMFFAGNKDVPMGLVGFAARLVLLAAMIAIFVIELRTRRAAAAHD